MQPYDLFIKTMLMAVILHVANGCMKACLSSVHLASYFVQFFQVLQFIRENGMKNLFEHDNQELTAANLIALLKPTYSPRGSAQHAAEEIVYSNLMHFVTAVEGEMKCFFLLREVLWTSPSLDLLQNEVFSCELLSAKFSVCVCWIILFDVVVGEVGVCESSTYCMCFPILCR